MATYEQLMDAARRADAAGDAAATKRFLELAKAARQGPKTNLLEQVGTGTNEGIASMLGMPVDAVNWGLGKLGLPVSGTPVGGSAFFEKALAPFMAEAAPETAGQRIGRRIGQDIGSGAVAAPLAGVNTLGGLGLNLASDVASGAAGGATAEVTDNPIANVVASLAGGMAVPAGAWAMRDSGAPSVEDLKRQAGRLYDQVDESDFRLTPDQTQVLQGNVSARMYDEGMYPPTDTAARGGVERVYELSSRSPEGAPSLRDLEDVRRYISRKVVPSAVPGEQRLGLAMKQEIDDYLKQFGDASDDVAALQKARETTRRYRNAETLDAAMSKAELRRAGSGIGGNTINAIRQNLTGILQNPKLAAGLTKAEREAMERIVRGTRATNWSRAVGGFAPQRGMLPGSFALGQAYMVGSSGNPIYAAPSAIGMVAQAVGEQLTKKQVRDLSAMLRAGKPITKELTSAERAVLNALLASQAAQHTPQ